MKFLLFLILNFISYKYGNAYLDMVVPDSKYALDLNLFEEVLDPDLCEEQVKYIMQNDTSLLIEFLDAGFRTPKGVLTGNFQDLGNYYQCLNINQQIPNSVVEGKFCMISVPLDQQFELPSFPSPPEWPEFPWPEFPWPELNPNTTRIKPNVLKRLIEYNGIKSGLQTLIGSKQDNRLADTALSSLTFNLAVCIPKVCSTQKVLSSIVSADTGLEYQDSFCRLPNDKNWVPGDYVAVAIFSLFGFLTILSTVYDIHYHKYRNGDPKRVSKLYQAFSVYTNTRRLVTYNSVPGTIECLDGIRTFAMMWVILGHTFVNQLSSQLMANPMDAFNWIMSATSVWITAGPITVDTFFMLSGLLIVYTTAGKFNGMKLIKNIHLFYLNRLLRMFPILAAMILLQVSFLNWVTDGPYWNLVMLHTHRCRVYWWSTLLHIQNYVNPGNMCLAHSWYLAIDVQLYIVSPLVLYWVLSGRRKVAWTALIVALAAILAASTTFNFIKEFPSATVVPSRLSEQEYYLTRYYVNTLTRGSPFFVGMIFGYILHLNRGKDIVMNKALVALLWLCSAVLLSLIVYTPYPISQLDWDNQMADNLINSFMRPAWATAVAWIIFACHHGYGGFINWLLSLRSWKVLGRLSYAMYIVHYPLIFLVNATPLAPVYFSVHFSLFKFLADFTLAALVAFAMTVFIDAPCSTLVKLCMGGGSRRPPEKAAIPANNIPVINVIQADKESAIDRNSEDIIKGEFKSKL